MGNRRRGLSAFGVFFAETAGTSSAGGQGRVEGHHQPHRPGIPIPSPTLPTSDSRSLSPSLPCSAKRVGLEALLPHQVCGGDELGHGGARVPPGDAKSERVGEDCGVARPEVGQRDSRGGPPPLQRHSHVAGPPAQDQLPPHTTQDGQANGRTQARGGLIQGVSPLPSRNTTVYSHPLTWAVWEVNTPCWDPAPQLGVGADRGTAATASWQSVGRSE